MVAINELISWCKGGENSSKLFRGCGLYALLMLSCRNAWVVIIGSSKNFIYLYVLYIFPTGARLHLIP